MKRYDRHDTLRYSEERYDKYGTMRNSTAGAVCCKMMRTNGAIGTVSYGAIRLGGYSAVQCGYIAESCEAVRYLRCGCTVRCSTVRYDAVRKSAMIRFEYDAIW